MVTRKAKTSKSFNSESIQETYPDKIKYVNWGFYDTYNGSAFDVLGSIKIF